MVNNCCIGSPGNSAAFDLVITEDANGNLIGKFSFMSLPTVGSQCNAYIGLTLSGAAAPADSDAANFTIGGPSNGANPIALHGSVGGPAVGWPAGTPSGPGAIYGVFDDRGTGSQWQGCPGTGYGSFTGRKQ